MKKIFALAIVFTLVISMVSATLIRELIVSSQVNEYYLSVNIIGSGSVSVNGSSPYTAGDVVKLTANPAGNWEFVGWSGDLTGTVNPEYLVMNTNKSITATFTEIPEYYLSVNIIGSGSVSVNGSSPYTAGDVVKLTANPAGNWEFVGWSGDLTGTVNPEYLVMNTNKSITATFTEIPEYYLSVNIIGSGSVSVNGSSPYTAGDVVKLTANPAGNWEFVGWSGDLTGTVNPEYLVMNTNKSITATFTEIPEYYLSVNIIGSGSVSVNGSSPYTAGDVVKLTANPAGNWEFVGWSGDLTGTVNPEYLVMNTNKSITATFTEIPEYYLSVNIIGSGIVAVNGSSPYDPQDVIRMTAFPSTGWEFAGWTDDLLGTTNPELLLMDSNKTVTCTFIESPVLMPTIESCDSAGVKKDSFTLSDKIYATGTGYQNSTTYDIYLVEVVTWVDGMTIPQRVTGTTTTITSDANGNIPATLLWSNSIIAGKYNTIVDVNGDGIYNANIDALDNDITN